MAESGGSSRAIIVLLCGVGAFVVLPFILGIVAWVLGNGALADIDRGLLPETDRQMVQIGRVLGIINTVLSAMAGCCAGSVILLPFLGLAAGAR